MRHLNAKLVLDHQLLLLIENKSIDEVLDRVLKELKQADGHKKRGVYTRREK
jgi:hypothetical protein